MRHRRRSRLAWTAGLLALGCRSTPATLELPPPSESPPREPVVRHAFERTIVAGVVELPDGGALLLGRRRPSETSWSSVVWIAAIDHAGTLRWTSELPLSQAWAERALVDHLGRVHVFGRGPAGAWLRTLDPEGRELAAHALPQRELLGFSLSEGHVELVLAAESDRNVESGELPGLGTWLHVALADPTQAERRDVQIDCDLRADPAWREGEYEVCEAQEVPEALLELDATRAPVLLEPLVIEQQGRALVGVQQGASASADARFVLAAGPAGALASALELGSPSEKPPELGDDPSERDAELAWLMPVVTSWAGAGEPTMAALGDWLLARDCDERVKHPSNYYDVAYYVVETAPPSFFAPDDACWRQARLADYLEILTPEQFAAQRDAWFALAVEYYEWVDGINAVRGLPGEAALDWLEPADFLHLLLIDVDSSKAREDAFFYMHELSEAELVPALVPMLDALRNQRRACESAGLIAGRLESLGHPPAPWQADMNSTCDVLYVLCAGMDPELARRLAPPQGRIRHEVRCAEGFAEEYGRCPASRVEPLDVEAKHLEGCVEGEPLVWWDSDAYSDGADGPSYRYTLKLRGRGKSLRAVEVTHEYGF